MSEAVTLKGLRFKLGKYRIILSFKFLDISDGCRGRTIVFPWVRK